MSEITFEGTLIDHPCPKCGAPQTWKLDRPMDQYGMRFACYPCGKSGALHLFSVRPS